MQISRGIQIMIFYLLLKNKNGKRRKRKTTILQDTDLLNLNIKFNSINKPNHSLIGNSLNKANKSASNKYFYFKENRYSECAICWKKI